MRIHYPAIKPYATHKLVVDAPHVLYVEECGNPQGLPVLFVHGGPGGGCRQQDRCFFDPEIYRIVLFDQRGCGRSRPYALLEGNHTQALVSDMERLRLFLDIDKWMLFGGSWGSTLSLVYAQIYPERVLAMVLRGIFLCRERDIGWFYREGASRIFPEYWQDFLAPLAGDEDPDLVAAYYRKLTSDNEIERMSAAKAWSIWEGRCATLNSQPAVLQRFGLPQMALALARIEAHYMVHRAFLKPNQILDRAPRLRGIPGYIVHGRYDMVCPVDQALALSRVWTEASLQIIGDAGHFSGEPGITDALIRATDSLAASLGEIC